MMPEIEEIADELAVSERHRHALVVLCLMRLKPYTSPIQFKLWTAEVTSYELDEIEVFLQRAQDNFIIDADGQPDPAAFRYLEEGDPTATHVSAVLLSGVLVGYFTRTADDRYNIGPEPLEHLAQ